MGLENQSKNYKIVSITISYISLKNNMIARRPNRSNDFTPYVISCYFQYDEWINLVNKLALEVLFPSHVNNN